MSKNREGVIVFENLVGRSSALTDSQGENIKVKAMSADPVTTQNAEGMIAPKSEKAIRARANWFAGNFAR